MTVDDLIAELEQYDRDAEVRVAIQPSYPLACDVPNVIAGSELPHRDVDDPARGDVVEDVPVVWIAVSQVSSSSASPYAPAEAWSGS